MPTDQENILQPDDLEVLQADTTGPEPTVRVDVASVETPVRTQELPRKGGTTRTRTVGLTPIRVLAADHKRAKAVIVSIGQNVLIALGREQAQDPSTMALWPQNVPYTATCVSEIWVASATATTSVSIISELWAAGD